MVDVEAEGAKVATSAACRLDPGKLQMAARVLSFQGDCLRQVVLSMVPGSHSQACGDFICTAGGLLFRE